MKSITRTLRAILLYDGTDVENFDIKQISDYLSQWFGRDRVQIRCGFVRYHIDCQGQREERIVEATAEDIGKTRIDDPTCPVGKNKLDSWKLDQEREWTLEGRPSRDVFYDGFALGQVYLELIPAKKSSLEFIHLAFTDRLIGSWDQSDRRYHARVSIYGWPSIISTTGVIEAPAKPREYYFGLMAGLDEERLRQELADRFIDYGDTRLTELLKGYAMQAIFCHLVGDPFCDNPDCRLFNAHWQEQMIRAQLRTSEEYCLKHRNLLEEFSTG